jgi:hypothetical protein
MSDDGNSIPMSEKLTIILKNDNYKINETKHGLIYSADIGFTDGGAAYNRFWNKYGRPPAEEYREHIIERRDLLVPQNIREVKGSFFTPKIWADKSKEYLAKVFGNNWQDEYYIWDCAAGTGNLLAGLTNKYNVWASDIDAVNVEIIKSLIDVDKDSGENLNLLPAHVFQFDFLNDSLGFFDTHTPCKLPEELKKIITDPEKRKKLIIYINPPYAEATSAKTVSGTGKNKAEVSTAHKTGAKYQSSMGRATNEISALFMARVYGEIPHCNLALFSKVKFISAQNFIHFRMFFRAEFKGGFVVHADTFDNVDGKFPIAFSIWDLNGKPFTHCVELDVLEEGGTKKFWDGAMPSINKWIKEFDDKNHSSAIAFMDNLAPDFQRLHFPYIESKIGTRHANHFAFTVKNIIEGCIYFAVRLCIEPTWLNDRDQFLYPNNGYKTDIEFQNNCLAFTLFHGQNRITCKHGINHWIPFTEREVDAKEKFDSNFMSAYLKGKIFSTEAQAVRNTGLELWKYYHAKIKTDAAAPVNASFYDIREFFQGRNEKGTMKTKSDDETYNTLLAALRDNLRALSEKIHPKVYEYGFLKK